MMRSYIDHAAYNVADLDWYIQFFTQVFDMPVKKEKAGKDGLRQVWLSGGIQLCEVNQGTAYEGHANHLSLITDDLDMAWRKALAMGCTPEGRDNWLLLPDGLRLELFPAHPGSIEALQQIKLRAE